MREIRLLTIARGIACLWVVAYHGNLWFPVRPVPVAIADLGFLGVDVFFWLSGYVMATVYRDLTLAASGPFWAKRLARLYPLHLAVLLVLAARVALSPAGSPRDGYAWSAFPAVAALVQPLLGIADEWNGPAWSVGVELLCYALFPLLIAPIRRLSPVSSVTLAGLCLAGSLLALRSGCHAEAGRILTDTAGVPAVARGLLGFAAGCLVRNIVPPAALSGTAFDHPALRPLHRAGEISYSIYLLQAPILDVFTPLAGRLPAALGPQTASTAAFVLALVVLVSVSVATYSVVERPGRALARRWGPAAPPRMASLEGAGTRDATVPAP